MKFPSKKIVSIDPPVRSPNFPKLLFVEQTVEYQRRRGKVNSTPSKKN